MCQQVHHQVMSNGNQINKEATISQQQVPTAGNQKKIMKTQPIQVNEINEGKGQVKETALNRLDYSRSLGDECLRKEPFL